MSRDRELDALLDRVRAGGAPGHHEQNAARGKLFVRERIAALLEPDSFVEDGLLANVQAADLPADGLVTGVGKLGGRTVAVVGNDSTVDGGSWGNRAVEKTLRIQERAEALLCPLVYLVDSAGVRSSDQGELFAGRRGAGRIAFNQVALSGRIPQVCVLFGSSAAGGAQIPAFCDLVIMVERLAGARMHCEVSGCGDLLAADERQALALCRRYLSYLPQSSAELPATTAALAPDGSTTPLSQIIPTDEDEPFDMRLVIERIVDAQSFFEIKPGFARELLTGFARIGGRAVGVIANQPMWLGGALGVDSADKAARFIELCDCFNLPLLFLADVPGFVTGAEGERQGILRAGAKMIAAVSQASVPRLSVIVRKAHGAGLYAMCGPAFEPEACIALQGASIRAEHAEAIDIQRLASELVIDAVVQDAALRGEIAARLFQREAVASAVGGRKHLVHPM